MEVKQNPDVIDIILEAIDNIHSPLYINELIPPINSSIPLDCLEIEGVSFENPAICCISEKGIGVSILLIAQRLECYMLYFLPDSTDFLEGIKGEIISPQCTNDTVLIKKGCKEVRINYNRRSSLLRIKKSDT